MTGRPDRAEQTANPDRTQVHDEDPTDQDWRAVGTEVRKAVEDADLRENDGPETTTLAADRSDRR